MTEYATAHSEKTPGNIVKLCPECGSIIKIKLSDHDRLYHKKSEQSFFCDVCLAFLKITRRKTYAEKKKISEEET